MRCVVLCWTAIAISTAFATEARAQGVGRSCVRFDRAYFLWNLRNPGGGITQDSTDVLILDSAAAAMQRASPGSRKVEVMVPRNEPVYLERRLTQSMWRPLPADSIEVLWFDGLWGYKFRLAEGDTLRGTVRLLTDVGLVDSLGQLIPGPAPRPTIAIRVDCPTGEPRLPFSDIKTLQRHE